MTDYAHALELAGLWPPGQSAATLHESDPNRNLLPDLCEAWRHSDLSDLSVLQRLEHWRDSGAALTSGIPDADQVAMADWIGQRMAFWPDGVPEQRRVGLLSSHLGRELDRKTAWFTALRAACTKINSADDLLVTAATVTADRFARRCHELFGIRLLDVCLPEKAHVNLQSWSESILDANFEPARPGVTRLFLSPEFKDAPESDEPMADRAVIALSQRLFVLSLKTRGRLLPLIQRRLEQTHWPVASVTLALGTDLVATDVAQPLLDLGAVGWVLVETLPSSKPANDSDLSNLSEQLKTTAPIIPVPSADRWSFLTHSTRRIDGPWPDQREEEYLDDLVLQRRASDHSALSALLRMIESRRIVASAETIRGSTPVVSFTSVPLGELPRMRVFRPHRSRWDFEPYGISIRRDWLEARGTRAVIYGDEHTWEGLADDERTFFQLAATRSGEIDWTAENEWRHPGDVDLSGIPPEAALVFVPDETEAAVVAEHSPWPVVVLTDADCATT